MLRFGARFSAIFLSACQMTAPPVQTPEAITRAVSPSARFAAVVNQIKPVAEAMCVDQNPSRSAAYCDFVFRLEDTAFGQHRARQTIGGDGRPVVTYSMSMLEASESADEIAFVLAHETGHQIANHLESLAVPIRFGAGFQTSNLAVRHRNLKQIELEADALAALVIHTAGYDISRGADAIRRFGGRMTFTAGSHPTVSERLEAVERVIALLETTPSP